MLTFLLLLAALACFALAAFGVKARLELAALGLACWVLPAVIAAWPE